MTKRYDLFIAVPMSSLTESEYVEFKAMLKGVFTSFEESGKHIFCAPFCGETVNFKNPAVAYRMDIDALKNSNAFVMIVPKKAHSGITYEAGYADALNMPMYWFVKDRGDLVYMVREADTAEPGRIHIEAYDNISDIPARLAAIMQNQTATDAA